MTAMFANGFPLRIDSFGQEVSEENIQMWTVNKLRTPSDDNSSYGVSEK
jgi:hypothetical protein